MEPILARAAALKDDVVDLKEEHKRLKKIRASDLELATLARQDHPEHRKQRRNCPAILASAFNAGRLKIGQCSINARREWDSSRPFPELHVNNLSGYNPEMAVFEE
jgi:hypothetical protein